MLHAAISGAVPSGPASPLGLVDFEELGELLRVSRPTLERLIRKDLTFPRLFKIGGRRYAPGRFNDLPECVADRRQVVLAGVRQENAAVHPVKQLDPHRRLELLLARRALQARSSAKDFAGLVSDPVIKL